MGKRIVNWQDDKHWSDRFLPEIKRILGEHLIGEPPIEEDAKRNTDLIVLKMEAVRIGCRIRRYKYLATYGGQFTIRTKRYSGNETELAKIIEGWGDYFFYGFSSETESALAKWTLLDLRGFRRWFAHHLASNGGKLPGVVKQNNDRSSDFRAFHWTDMRLGAIVAASDADLTNSPVTARIRA